MNPFHEEPLRPWERYGCHGVVSLSEIMKHFNLPAFIGIHRKLEMAITVLKSPALASVTMQEMGTKEFLDILGKTEAYCREVEFDHAGKKAFGLHNDLARNPTRHTGIEFAAKLDSLRDDLDVGMFAHVYVQVEHPVRHYLAAKELFGESVVQAFPSAVEDIEDAGKALAVGLHSAAVFHLMHVVEWGLRAFSNDLGLLKVVVSRKTRKTIPVAYSEWEKIIDQLGDKVDAKIAKMGRGEKKQKAQEFYYQVLAELRGFKDAWRNHLMHTRASYIREDAAAVWSHVQRFMKYIADHGISEV